jgi:hypothetical protein
LRAILQANAFGAYVIAPAALTVLAAVCLLIILHTNARQTSGMDRAQSPLSRATGSALEVSPVPSAGPVTATIPLRRTESPLASPSPHWNPDAVALNETFAPSHPAPPLPLTAQEALLLRSTRRGQPMEVAELDILREAALTNRVAEQRRTGLRDTVQGLLGPLATAQALTPSSTLTDVNQPPAVADSTTR